MKITNFKNKSYDEIIDNYNNGKITKHFKLNGAHHRTDGPAFIEYFSYGKIKNEQYCLYECLTRTDGPASITYDKSGKIIEQIFVFNDEHYDNIDDLRRAVKLSNIS